VAPGRVGARTGPGTRPVQQSVISVLTPFSAFLLAELVHASGVLAVVVTGLLLSQSGPRLIPAAARVQSQSMKGREWTLDDDGAGTLFRQASDLGITFWDTANVYAQGTSEEIVGRALKKYTSREAIVLATKIFWPMHAGPGGSGLSRKAIFEQVDASLARLGVEVIDLLQIHRFDPETPVEETMEALYDVVKAGKARYIGASSMWAWRFAKMQHVAEANGWTKFVSMQDQYSLLQREEEREMFALLAVQGVGSIPWSPLSAGKVTRPWGERGTTRSSTDHAVDSSGRPLFYDSDKGTVDAVQRIAEGRGVPWHRSPWRGC
jgi:aryl-alcohol dehydrogenase-like predicted oxidoreductase